MIDLIPNIRALILSDSSVTEHLTTYQGTKAVFSRRPTPEDAQYPLIIINPPSADIDRDFLDLAMRDVTYNIIVYGQNDTPENYRKIEETGFRIKRKFLRLGSLGMSMPAGYKLVRINSIGPFIAPTDDQQKVARAVSITITYTEPET